MGLRPGDPDYREAFQAALKHYRETHVICPTRCQSGFVASSDGEIDSYTQEIRMVHCTECKGVGFVHIQMELPF